MRIRDYRKFWRLSKRRSLSEKDYIAFQEFQAQKVLEGITSHISLQGKKMLDIGCGRGGYTRVFQKTGARVVSLDLGMPPHTGFFSSFVQADATRLPFHDESFDFIFSSSLIEHLPNPILMLREVKRVMKKDGLFYLSFPPFYSPVGGHQFKPFHMFLPEKAAAFMARKAYGIRSYRYDDDYGKLHIMTISKAKSLLRKAGLKIVSTGTRFSPLNLAKIPLANEILTWHVEFYLHN